MLFQLLQIYEFLSKSQQVHKNGFDESGCFSYCKYMNF